MKLEPSSMDLAGLELAAATVTSKHDGGHSRTCPLLETAGGVRRKDDGYLSKWPKPREQVVLK